jgi:hypothetical protein
MEQPDQDIFCQLYRDAAQRCFSKPLTQPLSETESKLFYQQVLDQTGLTVGWRSLKNYSQFVLDPKNQKDENPSFATLDTLARYVLKAPYTNEIDRKNDEGHHPYWFMYRQQQLDKKNTAGKKIKRKNGLNLGIMIVAIIAAMLIYNWRRPKPMASIVETFHNLSNQALTANGWILLNKDTNYWAKRDSQPGALTLYTLPGDNWPDSAAQPFIKNMLVHSLPSGCMTMELQMGGFVPSAEWQQAGLLLMQDTSLNSPSIRISLSFNDFFGGYKKPREVIVQAISSSGHGSKPEEFAHIQVLTPDSVAEVPTLLNNLKYSSIRIEKRNGHYRFLFASGSNANGAFKEIAAKDFGFEPHYVGIFAIKGRVAKTPVVPVKINAFLLQGMACE